MNINIKKLVNIRLLYFVSLFLLLAYTACLEKKEHTVSHEDYNLAAYVWPSCHDEQLAHEKLWSEGIGEWEIIQKGDSRFEGHYQPRIPLWGYKMDNDPKAWEQKIDAATDHGVNIFIFDWYWYNNKPFLEEAIDNGFLGARNNDKMNFYLMWANHDVPGNMWNHYRYKTDSLIWHGKVDWDNYKIIVDRIIKQYFKQPNYFKINNEPVFSIYSLPNLIKSFDDLEGTSKALNYFREEVKKAGFSGMHIQLIGRGRNGNPYLPAGKYIEEKSINEIVSLLGINSITTYNWMMCSGINEDYIKWGENAMSLQNKWDSILTIPYFPNVTIGWDNTPRYPEKGIESVVHYNNSPESFTAYLLKAKEYVDNRPEQTKLIIINAWNEWVEGSYLEPDMKWGYGYLEAVKNTMCGKYKKYQ
ncbi:MAG: glycoside hydrolase family 99-like domain-containing protein [Prolixibacteraceae bacterium]|jgi:hypothetical protein|nr:glycoside hydrolase family 99-like domain-containing protein [Prolixibacteraceae bacterium]